MDFLLDDFKDLIEYLKSHNTGSRLPWSEHDLHEESQGSSAYNIGSFQHTDTRGNKNDQQQTEDCSSNHNVEVSSFLENVLDPRIGGQAAAALPSSEEPKDNDGNICILPSSEFRSPLQPVPLFRSLAEGIPSPKFLASERQFLLDVFGLSCTASNPDSIQQPSCKRALLDQRRCSGEALRCVVLCRYDQQRWPNNIGDNRGSRSTTARMLEEDVDLRPCDGIVWLWLSSHNPVSYYV